MSQDIATGTVQQVNTKPRAEGHPGLPKQARDALRISPEGAEGDFNYYRARTLKNTPDQAILFITREVLDDLNMEGWPVQPGDLGENLTVTVPEASLVPGSHVAIGETVLQVTLACKPCSELYTLPYVGKSRGPEFLKTMVGRRGWYARVISGGTILPGMSVRVTAPAAGITEPR